MKRVHVTLFLLLSVKTCSSWDFFNQELSNNLISENVTAGNKFLCACNCVDQFVSCYGYVYIEEAGLCQLLSAADNLGVEPRFVWRYSSHNIIKFGEY